VTTSVELPGPTETPTVVVGAAPSVTASVFTGAGNAKGRNVGVFDKLVALALGVVAVL
jgi:hypothetical protein